MTFTLKDKLISAYQNWQPRMLRAGVQSTYAFMAAAALWPLAQAMQAGDGTAWLALGQLTAGIGTNLLANLLQASKDEADAAQHIAALPLQAPERAEIDAVLDKTDAVTCARESLPEAERRWFTDTLRAELQQLGTLPRFQASLTGSGAIAQGEGAVAVGQGGVHVGGDNHGNINTGTLTHNYFGEASDKPINTALGRTLYGLLNDRWFSLSDLEDIAFQMGIDWDALAGNAKPGKARALVLHCEQHEQLPQLKRLMRLARPNLREQLQ